MTADSRMPLSLLTRASFSVFEGWKPLPSGRGSTTRERKKPRDSRAAWWTKGFGERAARVCSRRGMQSAPRLRWSFARARQTETRTVAVAPVARADLKEAMHQCRDGGRPLRGVLLHVLPHVRDRPLVGEAPEDDEGVAPEGPLPVAHRLEEPRHGPVADVPEPVPGPLPVVGRGVPEQVDGVHDVPRGPGVRLPEEDRPVGDPPGLGARVPRDGREEQGREGEGEDALSRSA